MCRVSFLLLAPPGAVPVVGAYLYPSVLRSPGVTPQKCRAAHEPLHVVTSPPRLCWFCIWFMLGFSGMDVGYSVWCFFLLSLGLEMVFGCFALQDLTPCLPRCLLSPLSLSLSLSFVFGIFVGTVFLCLSLSGAGETQTPFRGFGIPLVSLHRGHALPLGPVRPVALSPLSAVCMQEYNAQFCFG